jgi:hypothetical protein
MITNASDAIAVEGFTGKNDPEDISDLIYFIQNFKITIFFEKP